MKKQIKNQKGASSADIIISIGIIMVFVSIVLIVYTNLNRVNSQILRKQTATNYAIAILENVDRLYYNEVTPEKFENIDIGNGKHKIADTEIARGYRANVTIQNYNETEGNENKLDVIKIVTVSIEYNTGTKDENGQNNVEEVKVTKIKAKEILKTPNKPILPFDMVAVKYDNEGKLIQTTDSDKFWYSYENKKWALAIKASDIEDGKIKEDASIYAWIPKFAYYNENGVVDVKFIYFTGERYIDSNGDIKSLEPDYQIHTDFLGEGDKVTGVWKSIDEIDLATTSAYILNRSTKYGPFGK